MTFFALFKVVRPQTTNGYFYKKNQCLLFVQLQNSFFKFKFPSFRRTSSKYIMKQQTRGQLCVEQTSKI